MSIVRSFSVGNGDMFCISHNSDNFTIIDCSYKDEKQRSILFNYVKRLSEEKGITRFISTHPDEDHIHGLDILDDILNITNFYVVANKAVKNDEDTISFKRYRKLREGEHSFYVFNGCSRAWINESTEKRGSSGIQFLWPEVNNSHFQAALKLVKEGRGFNNISPIFTYSAQNNVKMLWMGDIETSFLDKIKGTVDWSKVDVLFAPHHGRDSGHVSSDVLKILKPQIIVIGEAPSQNLNYYSGYETIKQNSAGDITFICEGNTVDIYVENDNYSFPIKTLFYDVRKNCRTDNYLGSFKPYAAK